MDYHLMRQGQDVGVFPLEELRRRRSTGELTGTEWVWCEGMAEWQPLDAALQLVAPDTPRPKPPPLPPKKKADRIVVLAVSGLVLLFIAGLVCISLVAVKFGKVFRHAYNRRTPGNDIALVTKPITWTTNTLTEADVKKRAGAFRVRQWLEGYKERGRRNPACDAEAVRFIESWIAWNYEGQRSTNQPTPGQLGDQIAANPACDDPLLLTATAASSKELHEKVRRLERALKGFEDSKHRAYPKFYATVTLGNDLTGNRNRVPALDASAMRLLKEAFSDSSLLAEDQAEMADILLNGWGENFYNRNAAAVCQTVRGAGKNFEWLAWVLEGEHHVNQAWKARGTGYADSVSDKGWQGFSTHLAAARESFTKAWKQRPDLPLAASRMITVAMGDSGPEEMRLWFDRALAAQIDYPGAWSSMLWGLRPRWHGSLQSMQALGIAAINTQRFDTDVPRKFFDVLGDLEAEAELSPGEHLYGRADIWPHLQRMYEGYIAEPSQLSTRDGWRSAYSVVAYLAGQYEVAGKQLEALNWEPSARNLGGWGTDLSLMPLEVAARTGPLGSEIAQAEKSYRQGNVAEALRRYTAQQAATGADERTRKFIRHRLAALEVEKRLEEGKWVDFLPTDENDPNWVRSLGNFQRLADGALEVRSTSDGHLFFSRARVGSEFEVKGEFEVVSSSDKSFQAGLVIGLPDPSVYNWYGFRMKRNDTEGEIAAVSRGWTRQQIHRPASLSEEKNSFEFRCQDGKVSATVNGKKVFRNAKPPGNLGVCDSEILLGVGAYNDMNETVIRYRNLQVRRLLPGKTGAGE